MANTLWRPGVVELTAAILERQASAREVIRARLCNAIPTVHDEALVWAATILAGQLAKAMLKP